MKLTNKINNLLEAKLTLFATNTGKKLSVVKGANTNKSYILLKRSGGDSGALLSMPKTSGSPLKHLGVKENETVTIDVDGGKKQDYVVIASAANSKSLTDLKGVAGRIHKGAEVFPVFELDA